MGKVEMLRVRIYSVEKLTTQRERIKDSKVLRYGMTDLENIVNEVSTTLEQMRIEYQATVNFENMHGTGTVVNFYPEYIEDRPNDVKETIRDAIQKSIELSKS